MGVVISEGEVAVEGEFGASHYSQWRLCCIVVQMCRNRLSCRLGGEWGQPMNWRIRCGQRAPRGKGRVREVSVSFAPYWFEWRIVKQCVKS